MSKVVYEGWMVRYGRRKIGRSYIHMRYFVLENRLLAYYKRKPQHNKMVYVLSVYNKKEKYHRVTMAAFNIQEALIWKENIESVIDQPMRERCPNFLSTFWKTMSIMCAVPVWPLSGVGILNQVQVPYRLIKTFGRSYHDGKQLVIGIKFVWPRELCYLRYWRRNDDGSYVVLFQSREHENCGRQPGFVRARIESLREYFSQTDKRVTTPRIPVMVNMKSQSVSSKRSLRLRDSVNHRRSASMEQLHAANRNAVLLDEDSDDDDDDFQMGDQEGVPSSIDNAVKQPAIEEEPEDEVDLSKFSGNLHRNDHDKARDCWTISDGNNFKVRGKNFCINKSKVPAGKSVMDLVAVDWFKDTKKMDHVARHHGCVAQVASDKGLFSFVVNLQVPGSTHYSMIFYFIVKELVPGSLLQRFVDGDDEFRNTRLKLIPSVPNGSWIVRQSVGSTPCLLGKAVDCNYIRGPGYLEVDVDIGSSTVANGVLGLVIGAVTSLVVDMAFLLQGNTADELPERLLGAVRVSHLELSSAIVPELDSDQSDSVTQNSLHED